MRHGHCHYCQVYSTGYAIVMDYRWASVIEDDDGYFLVLEVPPLLGGSAYFLVAWEILQALGFKVWRKEHHK